MFLRMRDAGAARRRRPASRLAHAAERQRAERGKTAGGEAGAAQEGAAVETAAGLVRPSAAASEPRRAWRSVLLISTGASLSSDSG